jgi:valyl-tRNA synthetase
MSKSKGNTIDPIEVQQRYGTDAVRFTMSILAAPGNDIPLAPERMEGYRAFANKLWNACRFVLMRLGDEGGTGSYSQEELSLVDRWILSEAQELVAEVTRDLEEYRFDRAADALYHFVWHQFCDWYIELVKPDLLDQEGESSRSAAVSRMVLLDVLGLVLRMLHPFMPFITEELWHKLPGRDGYVTSAEWPEIREELRDPGAVQGVERLKALVVKTRNIRAENRIDPGRRIDLLVLANDPADGEMLREQTARVATLVRADSITLVDRFEENLVAARGVEGSYEIAIPLAGLLDLEAEKTRLAGELAKLEKSITASRRKLENSSFLDRAPAAVVEKERGIFKDLQDKMERVKATMASFSGKGGA